MSGIESLMAMGLAFAVVAVSPGPANIAVATVAMASGRRQGLAFGLGLSMGLAFWGLVAATGMGAVLQGTAWGLTALKLFGGAYLLWLAAQSGRSALRPDVGLVQNPGEGRWFLRGLLLNLSNPKAVVAWMAALSMGLGTGDDLGMLVLATLMCMALGFGNYAGYALVFSRHGIMARYQRARRWIDGAVAGVFAVAGLGVLRSAWGR